MSTLRDRWLDTEPGDHESVNELLRDLSVAVDALRREVDNLRVRVRDLELEVRT